MVHGRLRLISDRAIWSGSGSFKQIEDKSVLGADREERLRKAAREAGFSNLRRAAQTPVNLILELTP